MPSPKPKYREVAEPAISANQLAQYLSAGPHARKRIISAARWQSTAIVSRYKQARTAIADCLCDATKSPSTAAKHRADIEAKLKSGASTAWTQADMQASIEALDRYSATVNATGLTKLDCKPVAGSVPPLSISGVRVKVTPDVIVSRAASGDKPPAIGAIVTMIAKGESSTTKRREQARVAAASIWLFVDKHLNKYGEPDRKLCLSYDVFDGSVTPTGSSITTRINNIHAACEEIALAWATATPPAGLDD